MTNFVAKVPAFVRLRKKVTKKRFLELADCDREYTQFRGTYDYFEILPPTLNIVIRNMKILFKKQKFKYTETYEDGFYIFKGTD